MTKATSDSKQTDPQKSKDIGQQRNKSQLYCLRSLEASSRNQTTDVKSRASFSLPRCQLLPSRIRTPSLNYHTGRLLLFTRDSLTSPPEDIAHNTAARHVHTTSIGIAGLARQKARRIERLHIRRSRRQNFGADVDER